MLSASTAEKKNLFDQDELIIASAQSRCLKFMLKSVIDEPKIFKINSGVFLVCQLIC